MSSIAKSVQEQIKKDLIIQNKRMKAYIGAQVIEDYDIGSDTKEEAIKKALDSLLSGEMDHLIGYKSS